MKRKFFHSLTLSASLRKFNIEMNQTKFKKLVYLTVIFGSLLCNAQNKAKHSGLFEYKNNAYSSLCLKDSVKSVKSFYSKVKDSVPTIERNRFLNDNDFRAIPPFVEFNIQGQLTKLTGCGITLKGYIYDDLCKNIYEYDEKDINAKAKYRIEFEQKFPVANWNLLIKPNENRFYFGGSYDQNGKRLKDLIQSIYQYKYDKSGRIIEESLYSPYAEDSIAVKSIKKEDLITRKTFIYNNKNQVIIQKITVGDYGKQVGNYSDFGTEVGYCDDLQLKYAYDSMGRITQVILFGCSEIVSQEDYKYNTLKNYVTEVKRFRGGLGSDDCKNTISYYNEFGDILKKELTPLDQFIVQLREPKYRFRYYDYDYDKHNNWIRCRMYLDGTQEGEPSIILEREIEYFNEIEK